MQYLIDQFTRRPIWEHGNQLMIRHFSKGSPQFFAVIIGSILSAILLVFLAVQAMPVFGWLLWAFTTAGVLIGASLWYRNEFAKVQLAEDNSRIAAHYREGERGRAELRRQRAARRSELMTKYAGDAQLVEHIVLGRYWQGQTVEQLKDALGNPADIAASMPKGGRREIWKYHPIGGDRYALWITLEQDLVARWEQRT